MKKYHINYKITKVLLLIIPISNSNNLQNKQYQVINKQETLTINFQIFIFIICPIIFVMSIAVIFYNQKRTTFNTKVISKLQSLFLDVNTQNEKITKILVNKVPLLYLSGQINIIGDLQDRSFNLRFDNVIKIQKIVQQVSSKKLLDKKFRMGWFEYQGNNETLKSRILTTNFFKIQQYQIKSQQIINKFDNTSSVQLTQLVTEQLFKLSEYQNKKYVFKDNYIYFYQISLKSMTLAIVELSTWVSNQLLSPSLLPVTHRTFWNPFKLRKQTKFVMMVLVYVFYLLSQPNYFVNGKKTKQEMIKKMQQKNHFTAMSIRILSFLGIALSIYEFLLKINKILSNYFFVIPSAKASATLCAALTISILLYLFFFSMAWLYYNSKTDSVRRLLCLMTTLIFFIIDIACI